MAKRHDPKLGAALGGLLAGDAAAPRDAPADARATSTAAPSAPTGDTPPGTYTRTARGYVKADGAKRERLSLYLTPAQLRRIKADAAGAGLSPAAYVVARLGLPDDDA